MQHVLSYPRYFPGPRDFRTYLLLYDRVSTIVPWNDQPRVRDRPEVAQLAEILDEDPLGFYDPTAYYGQWDEQPELATFATMLDKVLRQAGVAAAVRQQQRQGSQTITPDEPLFGRLRSAKWRYVSCHKMPAVYSDELFEKGLAIKVTETELTEAPMLVHPRLADYLFSRLTRQIVSCEPVTPLAKAEKDVSDIFVDGKLAERDQRMQLLALTIDIAIPNEIDELPSDRFRAMRDSMAEMRNGLSEMLQDFLVNLNIDSDKDARIFHDRLEHHKQNIKARIEAARRAVPWRDRIEVGVDIFGAVSGHAVGLLLGGGIGGIAGIPVGVIAARRLKGISTSLYPKDNLHVEQMAVLKNRILRDARKQVRQPPRILI